MEGHIKKLAKIGLIGSPFVILFMILIILDNSVTMEDITQSYRSKEYNGRVIQKYIDSDEHNFHKVVIKHEYGERTLLFDQEKGGVFDFIKVNDSIVKKFDTLDIRIVRPDLDTTITMRFE